MTPEEQEIVDAITFKLTGARMSITPVPIEAGASGHFHIARLDGEPDINYTINNMRAGVVIAVIVHPDFSITPVYSDEA